ncbi:hypothetical protein HALLA_14185 [Halostagnicola larsenii XH-48]|uniref:Uncharacterized protein n=1 Tax=Halostagnicola larsenii XH-48 TaxID=797299 RepID=W0JVG4_9EURY|nr:hypothetical protein HALLA_14185 [Halostagnicola larsenii XH-48]
MEAAMSAAGKEITTMAMATSGSRIDRVFEPV